MSGTPKKTLMRSLGEFFGHIWKGVSTDPSKSRGEKMIVRKTIKEDDRGDITLRRTTIDEIEVRRPRDE